MPSGGVLARIAQVRTSLPERLRGIAEWIESEPAAAATATIAEIARQTGTSPASVNRLSHALGYAGYAQLRVAVATENGRLEQSFWAHTVGAEIGSGDSVERMADILASADMRALQRTREQLDPAVVGVLAEALPRSTRVCLFGLSGSFYAADELRARLHLIGLPAWAWSDVHEGLAAAANAGPETTFICFSHSGRTAEAVEVLAAARHNGAMTVAVTSEPRSPLATTAEHVLVTTVEHTSPFRTQSLGARHSQLFLLDVLFVAVAHRTEARSESAYDGARRLIAEHEDRLTHDPRRRPPRSAAQ